MEPFLFGPSGRRLFGIFHRGAPAAGAGKALLLCNPFGQEAIRIHRLFRVLATRLARGGFDTLRFDYFGTGDSEGADEQGHLAGWCRDVVAAHDELKRRSGRSSVTWMGAGLGAVLAVLASNRVQPPPQRVVLWDPVMNGAAYLDHLRTKHVETLEASFSLADPAWRQALADDPMAFAGEAIGFAVSATLRDELTRLHLESLAMPATTAVHVVAAAADADAQAWTRARVGGELGFTPLESQFEWTAEELRGTALVPSAALKTLLAVIGD